MKYKFLFLLIFFLVGIDFNAGAQDKLIPTDTTLVVTADTILPLAKDTMLKLDTIQKKPAVLDAPVEYQAKDSIIMTAGNWAYLFGEGDVKYQQIQLQSENIEMNMDSSLVFAKFGLDSIGDEFGYPMFKDGDQQYESKTMRYNFKTKKGYITDVITQQGEGFVTAGKTKKMDDDVLNMEGGKYTTCDDHDHPHFYIQMTKAKVRPKKNIITGPVYMVFEDVPLYPIGLPFCFFPFSSTYSSGIIMPTFGDESARGFYLRDGGYYFAISDYMDLATTGEIYTKGSWGLAARSNYRKRYLFSGNFNAYYLVTKLGDKGLPDYSVSKDFKINWTHTQDPKANPYRTFSASVNFSTSSYDRNDMNSYYNSDRTQNTKGSSVNLTQRFPNSPFSISATMNINQISRDSIISVTLPDLTVTMSRIYPFKRKDPVGKERWYEKINMSYNGYFRNSITTKEDKLFKSNFVKDWRNAMQHQIPVGATFNVLKYINLTPSFNYTERWYTNKVEKGYDPQLKRVFDKDTTYGFYRVYDFSTSLTAQTTLYGFYKPLPFLGDKVQMIRHRFMPLVTLSYTPDFGKASMGFWKNLQYEDPYGNIQTLFYSPFENGMFGTSPSAKSGMVSFMLDNNIEMKIKSDRDSTGERKISLIDKLAIGMNYNLAADSFKWSDMSVQLRLKFSKNYTLNLNGIFDTYTYGYNQQTGQPYRVDVPRWRAGKGFGRLRSTGTSFSYTLNNETFSKLFGWGKDGDENPANTPINPDKPGEPELEQISPGENQEEKQQQGSLRAKTKKNAGDFDSDGYMINKIPWSLSFSYGLQLGYGDFNPDKLEYDYRLTHSLNFNGNIQPTKNWRMNFNATYDFDRKKISYMTCTLTRDLHCWQMSASIVPVGPYKSYTFNVAVSSSLLKDLKWRQSSSYRDGMTWY